MKKKKAVSKLASRAIPSKVTDDDFREKFCPEPGSYSCRKCLMSCADSDYWATHKPYPALHELSSPRLNECPADGPLQSVFEDPTDKRRKRIRQYFNTRSSDVRLCTPLVQLDEKTYGPLVPLERLLAEWSIETSTEPPKRVPSPDIASLWFHLRHSPWRRWRLGSNDLGDWRLSVPFVETFGEWANRVLRADPGLGPNAAHHYLDDLRLVEPMGTLSPKNQSSRRQATVLVPLDLRFDIDKQARTLLPIVREIQSDLLRMNGRVKAYRVKGDLAYRDLYCYMLSHRDKKTAREIAREVFPKEEINEAIPKVRRIISGFRKDLERAKNGGGVK